MIIELSIQKALAQSEVQFIDVRTPLEFAEGAIPGAINVPILSNEQRVEIGTLYKQKGAHIARERGLELVSPKFSSLFKQVKSSLKGKKPILYCWRGGLRSKTLASVITLTGLEAPLIQGGYKAYRNEVLSVLGNPFPFKLISLYGFTGTGKTLLLQKLKHAQLPVIDLEALAFHRGSVFGHVGISKVQTQKNFEALLYHEVKKYWHKPYIFIEGESRRIGFVSLSKSWMDQMATGKKILIKSPLKMRSERILNEYFNNDVQHIDQIKQSLAYIQKRLGGLLYKKALLLLETKKYREFVSLILESYYDRLYQHSQSEGYVYDRSLENNRPKDESTIIQNLVAFYNAAL